MTALSAASATATAMPPPASSVPLAQRGAQLFHGEAPLQGRIRGHSDPLPASALRCVNCHARTPPPASAVANPGLRNTQAFGPVLDHRWLTGRRERRGAPASAYDAAALCRALREGIDPQQVRMSRNMPLYELPEADCSALWAFLESDRP